MPLLIILVVVGIFVYAISEYDEIPLGACCCFFSCLIKDVFCTEVSSITQVAMLWDVHSDVDQVSNQFRTRPCCWSIPSCHRNNSNANNSYGDDVQGDQKIESGQKKVGCNEELIG